MLSSGYLPWTGEWIMSPVINASRRDYRQHRVGNPRNPRGIVLLLLGPVRELAVGHDVFRLGEGRNPPPVLESRVPAHMIHVQVRAHHIVDVIDGKSGR